MIYNPDFKVVEFDHFKSEAGLNTFVLSVAEWINKTNAIGLYVKRGEKLILSQQKRTMLEILQLSMN